jgi:hypothetical protein
MSNSNETELTLKLRDEVFLPALQEASGRARAMVDEPSILLNATVQAFGEMLVQVIGAKAAAHLLHGFADHIASHEPEKPSSSMSN